MPSAVAASLTFLALVRSSLALPSSTPSTPGRQCIDFKVPVTVDANNIIWDVPQVNNNIDVVDFVWSLAERSALPVTDRVLGTQRVQQTFTIRAQLCVPDNGSKKNVLQIATHGGNVGSAYWNSAFQPDNYSYVEAALNAGYSIMWYDRLGCGLSDKPNAYDIVQVPVHVEILRQLTLLARAGNLVPSSGTQQSLPNVPKFEKIVQIGHSLGSLIAADLISQYPNVTDGSVLTGFLPNKYLGIVGSPEFGLVYARTAGSPFCDRPSGYFVSATESNVQLNFFKKGAFDPDMLSYAATIKDTTTVAECVALPYEIGKFKAPEYSGPLLMAVGEHDYVVCDGNCTGLSDIDAIRSTYFPHATNLTTQVHPASGHALALHTNATGHFQAIFAYLDDNLL